MRNVVVKSVSQRTRPRSSYALPQPAGAEAGRKPGTSPKGTSAPVAVRVVEDAQDDDAVAGREAKLLGFELVVRGVLRANFGGRGGVVRHIVGGCSAFGARPPTLMSSPKPHGGFCEPPASGHIMA